METGVASIRKSSTSCTVFSVIQLPKNHMYSSPAHISNHRREVRTRVAAHLLREEVICFSIFYKKSKGSFNNFILFLPDYQMTFFYGSLATNTGLLNYMRLREDWGSLVIDTTETTKQYKHITGTIQRIWQVNYWVRRFRIECGVSLISLRNSICGTVKVNYWLTSSKWHHQFCCAAGCRWSLRKLQPVRPCCFLNS